MLNLVGSLFQRCVQWSLVGAGAGAQAPSPPLFTLMVSICWQREQPNSQGLRQGPGSCPALSGILGNMAQLCNNLEVSAGPTVGLHLIIQ